MISLRDWMGCLAFAGLSMTAITGECRDYFLEENQELMVEAEEFARQSATGIRSWVLTTAAAIPEFDADPDGPHLEGATGKGYLEILPDTRTSHDDELIRGENFTNTPGEIAVLEYDVMIQNPGRYYVWVWAHSTGTEDNGIHVGLDGEWPESGRRMQWCEGKRTWRGESKQRTAENHCGEPFKIYLDIEDAGKHTISFSMREDGFEFDRWALTQQRFASAEEFGEWEASSQVSPGEIADTERDQGPVQIEGELAAWHKVTLAITGPEASETDSDPNPFTDYRLSVRFHHESDLAVYEVPGYFAADGNAAETSATSGDQWRVHFAPDRPGLWDYQISFVQGKDVALSGENGQPVKALNNVSGEFRVAPTTKSGRDLRGKGRLRYVGERYLQFSETGEYFLKAGADAPETFLGYADFDGTVARKNNVPLKTWEPHLQDWRDGDPTWQDGKGKGMIGAVNYLASKGMNVFSFLTYNAGGDGDNVWPFVERDDKFHYDCSKLDQWGVVFDHATANGIYLHFKMQETEMDDNRGGHSADDGTVPTSLDGGALGNERKLYCRELVARFGHALALNWNLGEENTQSTEEQIDMINYLREVDPYDHSIVVHTFPNQQDEVYNALIGEKSQLTGVSLQNSHIRDTHWQTVKWVEASEATGKPWVVAFDESGGAAHGQTPDWGYEGFQGLDNDGNRIYTQHQVRQQTLWGTLMGGGAGVEYYFGYKLPQNDLLCEDWRSRDASWGYCRHALDFFGREDVRFWEMNPADALIGSGPRDNSAYCLAGKDAFVVYLASGQNVGLDLTDSEGTFRVDWYNPRVGGDLQKGETETVQAGAPVALGQPPSDPGKDWVVFVRISR